MLPRRFQSRLSGELSDLDEGRYLESAIFGDDLPFGDGGEERQVGGSLLLSPSERALPTDENIAPIVQGTALGDEQSACIIKKRAPIVAKKEQAFAMPDMPIARPLKQQPQNISTCPLTSHDQDRHSSLMELAMPVLCHAPTKQVPPPQHPSSVPDEATSPSKDFELSMCFDMFDEDDDEDDEGASDEPQSVGNQETVSDDNAATQDLPIMDDNASQPDNNLLVINEVEASEDSLKSLRESELLVQTASAPKPLVRAVTQKRVCHSVQSSIASRSFIQPDSRRAVANSNADKPLARIPLMAHLMEGSAEFLAPPLRLLLPDGSDLLQFKATSTVDYSLQIRTGILNGWDQLESVATLLQVASQLLWGEVREAKYTSFHGGLVTTTAMPWAEFTKVEENTGDDLDGIEEEEEPSMPPKKCPAVRVAKQAAKSSADSDGSDSSSSDEATSDEDEESDKASSDSESSDGGRRRKRRRAAMKRSAAATPRVAASKRHRSESRKPFTVSECEREVTPRPDAKRCASAMSLTPSGRCFSKCTKERPLPDVPTSLPTALQQLLVESMFEELQHAEGQQWAATDPPLLTIIHAKLMPKLQCTTVHALRQMLKESTTGVGGGAIKMRKDNAASENEASRTFTLKEQLVDTLCEVVNAYMSGHWGPAYAVYLQLPVARARSTTPPPTPASVVMSIAEPDTMDIATSRLVDFGEERCEEEAVIAVQVITSFDVAPHSGSVETTADIPLPTAEDTPSDESPPQSAEASTPDAPTLVPELTPVCEVMCASTQPTDSDYDSDEIL